MHNKFNQFIKNGLLINIGILLLGIVVFASYMEGNNLTFQELGDSAYWNIKTIDSNSVNISWSNDNNSSKYETIRMYEDNTFDVKDQILIESTVETVTFIHEDRDDIRVVYERERPDTNRYKVTYSAKEQGDRLIVRSDMSVQNIFTDRSYDGSITLYVPIDYECDTLTIESSLAKLDSQALPNSVDNLILVVDIADVTMTIDQPLDDLSVQADIGNLELTVGYDVKNVIIDCDSSSSDIKVLGQVDTMTMQSSIGEMDIVLEKAPESLDVSSDLGNVTIDFFDKVNHIEVEANMGDVDLNVLEDEDAKVYRSTNFSDFNSDLDVVSNKNKAEIHITSNMGSVDINANN